MTAHKFKPERTNGGCYFADCSCGWSGGVYTDRQWAEVAFREHRDGTEPTETGKARTTVILAPRSPASPPPARPCRG